MAHILLDRYLGKQVGVTKKGGPKYKNGFLKPKLMLAGARALRAILFDHLLDREVVSAALAIDYRHLSLERYLRLARRRADLLRVSREQRNMLPILQQIAPSYWARKDLFSRKLWVRDGRICTLVDYRRFAVTHGRFTSFQTRAAYRWLCKASFSVVAHWVTLGNKHPMTIENLARANITVKLPAIAWQCMVEYHPRLAGLGVSDPAQRFYRAFANECHNRWKRLGFPALRQWLNRAGRGAIYDISDWLVAEGVAQGFPDRHATWSSLTKRSADWHERVGIENFERAHHANFSWCSLLPETEIDEIVFAPLNSSLEIAVEGYRQHHCVGGYDRQCRNGSYRVYAVIEPDGTRSTLGLILYAGKWQVQQHRGKYNGDISHLASDAGKRLANLYQGAHDASQRKSRST